MKKFKYTSIIFFILACWSVAFISFAACITDKNNPKYGLDDKTEKVCYISLAPGAFDGATPSTGNLSSFLNTVFKFGIAIAVALTLIMIIWGGIMYMTTDAWSQKEAGKEKIINALWGLGMALISWLLLYTINPDLVNFGSNRLLNSNTIISRNV